MEALMDSIHAADFESPERINLEIHRRVSALAHAAPGMNDVEDPYTVASRQVFEELLMRCAKGRSAA
jgi:hypothetical protein